MNPPHFATEVENATEARRLTAFSRLLETTQFLAAHIDLDVILPTIIHQACQALECERATLYQYDPARQLLTATVATELEICLLPRSIDRGVTGYVARHGELVNIADPAADPRWDSSVDQQTGFRTESILAVPLKSPQDGQLLGVLELFNNQGGPFDHDDEEFASAFAQHAAAALDRARLVAQIEKQKQVEASLHVAREVQRRFMPTRMPAITGYEAAAWWFPNQHVGGDYCDIWKMSDGTVGLCVADVSGHGLGPSLLMASVRASLRTLLLEHAAAASLLEMLGRALNDDLQHGAFVTMILAMLDPLTHRLEFANAGHGPAFVLRPTATAVTTLEATGVPLGVLEHPHYPTGPVQYLEVGDIVVFCTDGIVEATNCEGTQFGLARLERLVAELASRPIQEIAERIGTAVTEYNVEDSPEDDLTVLLVRRIG